MVIDRGKRAVAVGVVGVNAPPVVGKKGRWRWEKRRVSGWGESLGGWFSFFKIK